MHAAALAYGLFIWRARQVQRVACGLITLHSSRPEKLRTGAASKTNDHTRVVARQDGRWLLNTPGGIVDLRASEQDRCATEIADRAGSTGHTRCHAVWPPDVSGHQDRPAMAQHVF